MPNLIEWQGRLRAQVRGCTRRFERLPGEANANLQRLVTEGNRGAAYLSEENRNKVSVIDKKSGLIVKAKGVMPDPDNPIKPHLSHGYVPMPHGVKNSGAITIMEPSFSPNGTMTEARARHEYETALKLGQRITLPVLCWGVYPEISFNLEEKQEQCAFVVYDLKGSPDKRLFNYLVTACYDYSSLAAALRQAGSLIGAMFKKNYAHPYLSQGNIFVPCQNSQEEVKFGPGAVEAMKIVDLDAAVSTAGFSRAQVIAWRYLTLIRPIIDLYKLLDELPGAAELTREYLTGCFGAGVPSLTIQQIKERNDEYFALRPMVVIGWEWEERALLDTGYLYWNRQLDDCYGLNKSFWGVNKEVFIRRLSAVDPKVSLDRWEEIFAGLTAVKQCATFQEELVLMREGKPQNWLAKLIAEAM
jgi:hypothetical protein